MTSTAPLDHLQCGVSRTATMAGIVNALTLRLHCHAVLIVAALLGGLAGCERESAPRIGLQAESDRAALADVMLVTTDYAFQTPDTIRAGWTTFRMVNHGAQAHAAQLVKLEEGRTLAEYLRAYEHAWRTAGLRPAWGKRFGGPGAADSRDSTNATINLEPGSYGWYCPMNIEDGTPHVFAKGMARALVVLPNEDAAAQNAPEPTLTIQLLDYAFHVVGPIAAGSHVIRVENLGVEPHEVAVGKLLPGKTAKDLEEWLEDFEGPPPATGLGGINAVAPGVPAYFEIDFTPGDYVFFCNVVAPDGRTHVAHGMISQVNVR